MLEIVGLLIPLLIVAAFGFRPGADNVTHWRYYVLPALFAVVALVMVLTTEPGDTPDFWVGVSASLAGIAAAVLVLIFQGFAPLNLFVREGQRIEGEELRGDDIVYTP